MPEENLYKRGDIWWLKVTVKGNVIRTSLRTCDVKVARRLRDERIAALEAEAHYGVRKVNWGVAVLEWQANTHQSVSQNTMNRYLVSLKQCFLVLTKYTIHEITGKVIQEVIDTRRRDGATPATIRRDLTAISQVLEFAIDQEWRTDNPTLQKRKRLQERRAPIVMPPPHDVHLVIDAAPRPLGAITKAAYLTGCRQNELVQARWRDFDKIRGTLTIIGKGTKRRTITLSDTAKAHFQAQPRTLGCDLIFHKDGGRPFKDCATDFAHLRTRVARREGKAERPFVAFRFHDLRHAFAVNALKSGMSIYVLQKHLGHSSIAVTEMYLEHLTPEEQESAKRGVGTF